MTIGGLKISEKVDYTLCPDGSGWIMGPYGPEKVYAVHGCWWYHWMGSYRQVFSTESACYNGKEPRKKRTRKNGTTHAERTAKD